MLDVTIRDKETKIELTGQFKNKKQAITWYVVELDTDQSQIEIINSKRSVKQ